MFHIHFAPIRRDDVLILSASGDTLLINGATLDLSDLPEGATLPRAAVACEQLAGDIERRDGVIHLSLILPHGPIPHPPPPGSEAVTHPQPILITADGPIPLPHWAPAPPTPEEAAQ